MKHVETMKSFSTADVPGLPMVGNDWLRQVTTRTLLLATWLVLSFAAGQQWLGDSPDLRNYLAFYNSIGPFFDLENSRFEFGYQAAAWLAVRIGLDYFTFTVLLAGFSLGAKFYLFERYMASPLLAAFSYVLGFYLLHEYTQIRAAVGLAFALLGIHAMLERRWFAFVILSMLAFSFHYSMIVMPVVALASRQIKSFSVLLTGALVLLLGIILLPLIGDLLLNFASALNPLTSAYFYNDLNVDSANILSFASVMTVGIICWRIILFSTFKSEYLRIFFGMALASYMALVLLQQSLELALRLRDALAISLIFLVFREPITARQVPSIVLWFAAAAYLFYGYSTSQVLA